MRPERDLEAGSLPLDRIVGLRQAWGEAGAEDVLAGVLAEFPGEVAIVSSFGAEAAVLLHMVSRVDPGAPVILVDTLMLFEATLEYQQELSRHLGLTNVIRVRPDALELEAADPEGTLNRSDPDACCSVRKVVPLERALAGFRVTVSGRKRFQASTRAALGVFEADGAQLRVNPLARWSARDLADYMEAHDLPRHPLVAKGYLSIGCSPCTTRVAAGEDPRAGRWRGTDKVECGIHFAADGSVQRAVAAA